MKIQGTNKNSLKALSSVDFNLKGNILLAEDNHIDQKVGISLLREIGYRSHVVNNKLDALQALAENHYVLFLMDVTCRR